MTLVWLKGLLVVFSHKSEASTLVKEVEFLIVLVGGYLDFEHLLD